MASHRKLTEKADFRETLVVQFFVRALAPGGTSRAPQLRRTGGDALARRPPNQERAAALPGVAMQRSAS
jgi:hypothetical protein